VIVLDTHAWIWWATRDGRLSRRAQREIDGADACGVSPVSCYEVARLSKRGRIRFDRDVETWIRQALTQPHVVLLDVTPEICTTAAMLADFHGDPFDRILAATALEHDAAIVTKDTRIRSSGAVRCIW
jgi:PIN domain nuclease of toxin-antitoxin system